MTTPAGPLVATGSQTVGPFFHVGPASTDRFGHLAAADTPGDHIRLRIGVVDGDGRPVPDAMVELWQADAAGTYSRSPMPAPAPGAFTGFGRLGTGEDGWCVFETVRPGAVPGPDDSRQAAHINVCVFARGLLRHLYTRIYFAGDPALAGDSLLSVVPDARRSTLLARPTGEEGTWAFRVTLQGDDETVFFDV